jgi:hypothetical protein
MSGYEGPLLAASLGLQAVGFVAQGAQAKAAADYNARVAENAAVAERQRAEVEVGRHRRRAQLLLSSQRAAAGASGVQFEGSPLLVMAESAAEAEYDAQLIRYGGETRATNLYAQAAAERMQGRAARIGSYFGAASSLLKAGAAASGKSGGNKILLGDSNFDSEYA